MFKFLFVLSFTVIVLQSICVNGYPAEENSQAKIVETKDGVNTGVIGEKSALDEENDESLVQSSASGNNNPSDETLAGSESAWGGWGGYGGGWGRGYGYGGWGSGWGRGYGWGGYGGWRRPYYKYWNWG